MRFLSVDLCPIFEQTGAMNQYDPDRDIDPDHPLEAVIDRLDELTHQDEVTLADLIGAFGARAFLPLIIVLGLFVFSPLSGIPILPSFCGLMIAALAGQMLLSGSRVRMPGFLARRGVSGERLHRAIEQTRRVARWVDRLTRRRMLALTVRPLRKLWQGVIMVSGLTMPFLELVPFSSSILAAGVLCMCLALLSRDGLFVVIGLVITGIGFLIPLGAVSVLSSVLG
ncbi:exopolysaccharide biosynthesis protein [Alphaproteobacteria bacterium KMM 3653]|uniref:Exopolysaccharide biosynthesis protein n=1 Tax=Harenicola maris TaxID=2841044 RepID=A0AAP2G819_9RHOB|nr:exopolysaccharide biosynthesis protein [Harenicola maris]